VAGDIAKFFWGVFSTFWKKYKKLKKFEKKN